MPLPTPADKVPPDCNVSVTPRSPDKGHRRRSLSPAGRPYKGCAPGQESHNTAHSAGAAAGPLITMKLCTVILSLALIAGAQANLLHWNEEPKTQLEQIKDSFWQYVAKATSTAEDTVENIKQSQWGQEINDRISENINSAVELRSMVSPMSKDLVDKIVQDAEDLRQKILKELNQQLSPYADEMNQKVEATIEQLRLSLIPVGDRIREQVNQGSENLRHSLSSSSEEMKHQIQQTLEELKEKVSPYTDNIREKINQHIQEFQKNVNTEEIQVNLGQKLQAVQQNLAPYAEDLKEKLNPYAEDLQKQLSSLWDSFLERMN